MSKIWYDLTRTQAQKWSVYKKPPDNPIPVTCYAVVNTIILSHDCPPFFAVHYYLPTVKIITPQNNFVKHYFCQSSDSASQSSLTVYPQTKSPGEILKMLPRHFGFH